MKRTLAIVGSHPRTRGDFDWSREDCDIWVFNEAVRTPWGSGFAPRADAVFQMHQESIWRNPGNRNDPRHPEWLMSGNTPPVYMQQHYPDVPGSVEYPLDEIRARWPLGSFTSSVAYAIALGCHLGYQRLELWAVEMETNTEYQYQRDGVTFWIGVAVGLGIEVESRNSLFDNPLYGYEGEVVIPYERFDERIAELEPSLADLAAKYEAAALATKAAVARFKAGDNSDAIYAVMQAHLDAAAALGDTDGAIQENRRYKSKADKMRENAQGDFLFSRQEFESAAKMLSDRHAEKGLLLNSLGTKLDLIHQNITHVAKGSPKRARLFEAYEVTLAQYLKANNLTAVMKGAAQENFRYLQWLDKRIRAAGGVKSEALILETLSNAAQKEAVAA